MDAFSQTLGVVIALCIGVVALTLFFKVIQYFGTLLRGNSGKILVAQDFIKKDSLVTVKITGGETLERVKFVGFTKSQIHGKDSIPFPFARMAVFENEAGERIFIPSTTIQFIREIPAPTRSESAKLNP
jgi:hypothetical protein